MVNIEREKAAEESKNGVVFVVFDEDRILLEERLDPEAPFFGYTIIPGGAIEEGETIEQTLIRELKEECGIVPEDYQLIGSFGKTLTRHVFLVDTYQGEIVNKEQKKSRHLWSTLKKARILCEHRITQQVLDIIESSLP